MFIYLYLVYNFTHLVLSNLTIYLNIFLNNFKYDNFHIKVYFYYTIKLESANKEKITCQGN